MNAVTTPEVPQEDTRNRFGFQRAMRSLIKTTGPVTAKTDQSIGKNEALPWVVMVAIVSCSMGGVALGISVGARDRANEAERIAKQETRLQRLELDELKVALKTQGIKVHEGSTP